MNDNILRVTSLCGQDIIDKVNSVRNNSGIELEYINGDINKPSTYNQASVIIIDKYLWNNYFGTIYENMSPNSYIILAAKTAEVDGISQEDFDLLFDVWVTDNKKMLEFRIFNFFKRIYDIYATETITTLNNLPFPVIILDRNHFFVNANDYFYMTFGEEFDSNSKIDFSNFADTYFDQNIEYRENKSYSIEVKLKNDDKYYAIHKSCIYDNYSQLTGYFYLFRNTTVQKRYEEKLKMLAEIDELTKINNKKAIRNYFNVNLQSVIKYNQSFTVMMFDLDNFKLYNDYYGHVKGDDVLISLGEILSRFDNGDDEFTARFGGEEFIFIGKKKTQDEAKMIAETIIDELKKKAIPHEKSLVTDIVSISIGVAYYDTVTPNMSVTALINNADVALYEAKNSGKNKYVFRTYQSCAN